MSAPERPCGQTVTGQTVTPKGIIVCACGHQAVFHHEWCSFCGCNRPGSSFDYTQKPELRHMESPEPILQFFAYDHLPVGVLQDTSRIFGALAEAVVRELPRNPERTVALRKLLEAKDAAVRAVLYKA